LDGYVGSRFKTAMCIIAHNTLGHESNLYIRGYQANRFFLHSLFAAFDYLHTADNTESNLVGP
jgi:hypothetical protein